MKQKLLFGVSAGVAIVLMPELIKKLSDVFDVHVIMTKHATDMLEPEIFKQASGNRVYVDLFESAFDYTTIKKTREVEHIELAKHASLFVVAPATANTIAQLASGMAGDYLTTVALAVSCPVLVCPSMNTHMWQHPAVVSNIQKLRLQGIHTFGPDTGMLACGYEGKGRLPSVKSLAAEIHAHMSYAKLLKGKRVLVTTGGTIEPIDAVRTISNRSSGKMGIALAESCAMSGAVVHVLRSSTSVSSRFGIQESLFETTQELQTLLETHAPSCDICIHAAAVSDFSVTPYKGKISSAHPLPLELTPKTKILDMLKQINPAMYLVAFKAEYNMLDDQLAQIAHERLKTSRADLIIANDIGRKGIGFQSNENEAVLVKKDGTYIPLQRASKSDIARRIVIEMSTLMELA